MGTKNNNVVYFSEFFEKTRSVAKVLAPAASTAVAAYLSYGFALDTTLILIISSVVFLVTLFTLLFYQINAQTNKLSDIHEAQLKDRELFNNEIKELNSKIFSGLTENIPYGAFEIYLKYKSLSVKDFSGIVSSISRVHTIVYAIINNIHFDHKAKKSNFEHDEYYEYIYQELELEVIRMMRFCSEDDILISQIHTGESIKFEFKSGWLPSYRTKDGDFIVGTPRPLAPVLLTGYLLSAIINYGVSSYNELLDAKKTNLEIEKLQFELDEFRSKAENSNEALPELLDMELRKIGKNTIRNHEIKSARVTMGGEGRDARNGEGRDIQY